MTIPFPSSHLKTRRTPDNKQEVLDTLRRQYVKLTPEEEVRQSLIEYLIRDKAYPKGVIAVEHSFTLNGMQKRADIIVFSAQGKPAMLIECKAPHITLSQEILNQASRYNQIIKAPLVCLYNGHHLLVCQLDTNTKQYHVLKDLPEYKDL